MPGKSATWKALPDASFGFMNVLDGIMASLARSTPQALPNMRDSATLLLCSDYSGEHRRARYQSIGLMIADLADAVRWCENRAEHRRSILPDRRRISYKNLRDRRRRMALPALLGSMNRVRGILVVILVDRRIRSMFTCEAALFRGEPEFGLLSSWGTAEVEKLLRVVHITSLFLAGLSAPDQNVLWITDQDAIAANPVRLSEMVEAFRRVASHYLKHDLAHVRVGTTASDSGDRDLEDLVAIPDLAAGAIQESVSSIVAPGGLSAGSSLISIPPMDLAPKAKLVTDWFADATVPMKRTVLMIEEVAPSHTLLARRLRFYGSREAYSVS